MHILIHLSITWDYDNDNDNGNPIILFGHREKTVKC